MAGNGKGGGYGPSIPLTRLYERVSKNGNHYLTARLGAAKITILKSSDLTDDGTPIWHVLLSEGPAHKAAGESDTRSEAKRTDRTPNARETGGPNASRKPNAKKRTTGSDQGARSMSPCRSEPA
jgi:hypothetical protein